MYGAEWTGERVTARLVEAFRRMPDRPIYSPVRGVLMPVGRMGIIDGAGLILVSEMCLGESSKARVALLTYARARSQRRVAPLCREMGISRATLYRRARSAAEAVADCLNTAAAARRIADVSLA